MLISIEQVIETAFKAKTEFSSGYTMKYSEYLDGFNQYGLELLLQDTEDAYELGMAIGMANGWIGLANGKWMNE
ncbi:hypothetical protein DERP_015307 [Dermatophagoides pteronyssinus]|uniref:Uncharacterized protein n=1 Tax=Dermatophagoides pteronyssinus TaxID=6956 RepID=A0ABQ8JUR5_DERPT|nr:hypothetical protein DERP_015307 [Dermatophagoides pteronyssinus]